MRQHHIAHIRVTDCDDPACGPGGWPAISKSAGTDPSRTRMCQTRPTWQSRTTSGERMDTRTTRRLLDWSAAPVAGQAVVDCHGRLRRSHRTRHRPDSHAAMRSATMIVDRLVVADGMVGITDASASHRPVIP